jgi:hypothetical protein
MVYRAKQTTHHKHLAVYIPFHPRTVIQPSTAVHQASLASQRYIEQHSAIGEPSQLPSYFAFMCLGDRRAIRHLARCRTSWRWCAECRSSRLWLQRLGEPRILLCLPSNQCRLASSAWMGGLEASGTGLVSCRLVKLPLLSHDSISGNVAAFREPVLAKCLLRRAT